MHRCLAPCVDLCTSEAYEAVVEESVLFLSGKNKELLARLQIRMMGHAEAEEFEDAARVRDLIKAVTASLEAQITVDKRGGDRDVWALARAEDRAMAVLLPYRAGRMQESRAFPADGVVGTDGELLSTLMMAWYAHPTRIPAEVLAGTPLEDEGALAEVLRERKQAKVTVRTPQRGEKTQAVVWDEERRALRRRTERCTAIKPSPDWLRSPDYPGPTPHRVFDNSNIQGSDPVSSQVVSSTGRPIERYRGTTVQGPDDYATM